MILHLDENKKIIGYNLIEPQDLSILDENELHTTLNIQDLFYKNNTSYPLYDVINSELVVNNKSEEYKEILEQKALKSQQ